MATINSLKSNENVMDTIQIYLNDTNQKPIAIKTQDYKTCAEIKQLIIDYLVEKYQGNAQFKDVDFPKTYQSYNLVVQIRPKKQQEILFTRKINNLERPFNIKKYLLQNSKLESHFIFEDSTNTAEYTVQNQSPTNIQIQEQLKYIRTGHVGKLRKNESFVELVFSLYPDHILYSQVKNKNKDVKIIPLESAQVQQLVSLKYKNCFQVIGSKIYTFKANSKIDLQGWIIEIYKCINNLQDKKQLDQIDEEMMKSERMTQNHLVQVLDRSNMRCFKCIKKLAYRDKFMEFLMSEQERYFINSNKQNDKYSIIQNVIKMVNFIAKTQFNFPPFESPLNAGCSSNNNSLGSSNNLDMSQSNNSYNSRKGSKTQDCVKLLREFFDNQMQKNQFFSNFVFKLLEQMHRLQYNALVNQFQEKYSQQNLQSGINVQSNDTSHYTQFQFARISATSAKSQYVVQNNKSELTLITSGSSTPNSKFNTNNTFINNINNSQMIVNDQDKVPTNNQVKEQQHLASNEQQNKFDNQMQSKELVELKDPSQSSEHQITLIYSNETQQTQQSQQQNTQQQLQQSQPQQIYLQEQQSQVNRLSQQSQQQLQNVLQQNILLPQSIQLSQNIQLQLQQSQQLEQQQQQIFEPRKIANKQSISSSNFCHNQNNHDDIIQFFNQQNNFHMDFKLIQDPKQQAFSFDDLNSEIGSKQVMQSQQEIPDSIFFQNTENIQTSNNQIELTHAEFEKQVQNFTNEQIMNLLLGYIEVEAFSSYVKNGQYYKQIIKSRQQMYQQLIPKFELLTKISNLQLQFPESFANQANNQRIGNNSGIAKVASKK